MSLNVHNFYVDMPTIICRFLGDVDGCIHGYRFRRIDFAVFRSIRGVGALLRDSNGRRKQIMNWMYWVSGVAALAIFIYLVVALFKPELFS